MRIRGCAVFCVLVTASVAPGRGPVETPPLRGTVLTADGTPAPGANVWAAKYLSGPLVRRETVADAQGRFSLDLGPGRWFVWARRGAQGGEAPARHETVDIVAGRAAESVTIRLEERGTLRGRLLEAETGRPIAGGKLFLDAGLVLTTDDAGRFEVGGLTRDHHEAFVVAAGRARIRVLFDTTARADTELDVPVPPGGKIIGRVTDVDGKPIPGAYVGRSTSGSYFSINALFEPCGPDGQFEFDGNAWDRPQRLSAAAPGYVSEERDGLVVAAAGSAPVVNFRLRPKPGDQPKTADAEPRRVVSGVVRAPDGQPIVGVLVRWGYMEYVGATEARTDAAGRFRFTVPDKDDTVAVLPRAYPPQFPKVSAGGDQVVDIKLQAGHIARGRVVDADDKPITGVHVIAVTASPDPRIGNPYWLRESQVRTDAEGRFEMLGVPARASFDFMKPGLSTIRSHHLQLDGVDNTVMMVYGGAISGRVVDHDGKPIRSFRVLVNFPRERRQGDRSEGFFAGYSGTGVNFTSPDGSFVLTGIGASCVYRLSVMAEGHGAAVADRVQSVALNRLAGADVVTLPVGPPVALRVRALTADNKPVAGARVTLVNGQPNLDQRFSWGVNDASWEDTGRTRTGADGWADFPALGFTEATVLVQASGYARHKSGWRNGQQELTARMLPEAVVTGVVRDATGAPVKSFYVNLTSGGDQLSVSARADDQGRFRVAELPAGTWSLMVRGDDGQSRLYQGQVVVDAGETKELLIDVAK